MLEHAAEMVSNELTERSASSRHQNEIFVFPVGRYVAPKPMIKLVFRTFFAYGTFLNFCSFSSGSILMKMSGQQWNLPKQ